MSSRSAVRITRLGRVVLTLLLVCGVVVGSVLIWRVARGQSGSTDNAPSVAAAAGSAEEPVKSAVAAPSEDSEPGRPGT